MCVCGQPVTVFQQPKNLRNNKVINRQKSFQSVVIVFLQVAPRRQFQHGGDRGLATYRIHRGRRESR